MLLCQLTFVGLLSGANFVLNDVDLRNKMELGRQQFELVVNNQNSDPKCWKDSILTLMNEQCSSLNYESRSKTALKLAVCHLKQSGVKSIANIDSATDINIQMIASNGIAFATYNQFFTAIDNICVYVQRSETEKKMKKSIYGLYTATIESTDYLRRANEENQRFQTEISNAQSEIKKSNEDILGLHNEHKQSIDKLKSTALNIETKQSQIFAEQSKFERKQSQIFETVLNIDDSQQTLLENQEKSIKNQESLSEMQNKFETEMNTMYESHSTEINNAQTEIKQLTQDSHKAYNEIMAMINQALFALNIIYEMDLKLLAHFISIQSFVFYSFWTILCYVCSIPKSAHSVRFILFLNIFICIALERNIVGIIDAIPNDINDTKMNDFYDLDSINEWRTLIRKSMFALNLLMFAWFTLTYRDPITEQTKLLQKLTVNTQNMSQQMQISGNYRLRKSKRIMFISALKSITPQNIRGLWARF